MEPFCSPAKHAGFLKIFLFLFLHTILFCMIMRFLDILIGLDFLDFSETTKFVGYGHFSYYFCPCVTIT